MSEPARFEDMPRKPFWAKCPSCSHCWPAAYAPMEVALFAKTVMRAACPMCACSKGILIAKQNDGELLEGQAG
jgi:hypothetical protein